jgi:recombination associated protein RdgC
VKDQAYPPSLAIEQSCVLQDPNQQRRIIRCQHQDLFTHSIQSLLKEGVQIKELAINWQDRISFTVADDFSFKSITFHDEVTQQTQAMEPETEAQQFDVDFLIMTDTLSALFNELLALIEPLKQEKEVLALI